MGILDIYSQLGQQAMQPGGMLGMGLAQPTTGQGGVGYQPNYPLFWNPRQMLGMGQPSFTDPMWYMGSGNGQRLIEDPIVEEQPTITPQQQQINNYLLRQQYRSLGLADNRLGQSQLVRQTGWSPMSGLLSGRRTA